jgi:hypothetical protein
MRFPRQSVGGRLSQPNCKALRSRLLGIPTHCNSIPRCSFARRSAAWRCSLCRTTRTCRRFSRSFLPMAIAQPYSEGAREGLTAPVAGTRYWFPQHRQVRAAPACYALASAFTCPRKTHGAPQAAAAQRGGTSHPRAPRLSETSPPGLSPPVTVVCLFAYGFVRARRSPLRMWAIRWPS